jgi:hypothetical protein
VVRAIVLAAALVAGCKGKSEAPPAPPPTLVKEVSAADLLGQSPTFVAGTAGDDFADLRIATQIGVVRGLALPNAPVIDDVAIARDGWPETPILYGSEDTNAALAAVAARLPFRVTGRSISIGGETFKGPGYPQIAAVPASGDRPELGLYAGTVIAGIAEINAGPQPDAPIVVSDVFGPLVTGVWKRSGDDLIAVLGDRRRRIEYRSVNRELDIGSATFLFPKMVDERPADAEVIAAATRGLATVAKKLDLQDLMVAIYVYPDRRSKESLTGNAGDGHAVPSSRALHIIGTPGPMLEALIAHEATHSIAYYAWGPSGTALMGEGLAVWVAGGYQGKTLSAWAKQIDMVPISRLLSVGWREIPEAVKYPLAGLLVDVAIETVGVEKFREHLLGATWETWGKACAEAGTGAEVLETRLRERLTKK